MAPGASKAGDSGLSVHLLALLDAFGELPLVRLWGE